MLPLSETHPEDFPLNSLIYKMCFLFSTEQSTMAEETGYFAFRHCIQVKDLQAFKYQNQAPNSVRHSSLSMVKKWHRQVETDKTGK